jgi:cytidylate kinase
MGYHLLDSGALYRLVACKADDACVDFGDAEGLAALAADLDVSFVPGEADQPVSIFLDGKDVSQRVRLESTGKAASKVAPHPAVREALHQRQRGMAQAPGLVADGRDMGTVVFPEAPLKIYLTASSEERARRRVLQLQSKGQDVNITEILCEIEARDEADINRAVSPLKPALDAVVIDTTDIDIDSVCEQVLRLAQDKGLNPQRD